MLCAQCLIGLLGDPPKAPPSCPYCRQLVKVSESSVGQEASKRIMEATIPVHFSEPIEALPKRSRAREAVASSGDELRTRRTSRYEGFDFAFPDITTEGKFVLQPRRRSATVPPEDEASLREFLPLQDLKAEYARGVIPPLVKIPYRSVSPFASETPPEEPSNTQMIQDLLLEIPDAPAPAPAAEALGAPIDAMETHPPDTILTVHGPRPIPPPPPGLRIEYGETYAERFARSFAAVTKLLTGGNTMDATPTEPTPKLGSKKTTIDRPKTRRKTQPVAGPKQQPLPTEDRPTPAKKARVTPIDKVPIRAVTENIAEAASHAALGVKPATIVQPSSAWYQALLGKGPELAAPKSMAEVRFQSFEPAPSPNDRLIVAPRAPETNVTKPSQRSDLVPDAFAPPVITQGPPSIPSDKMNLDPPRPSKIATSGSEEQASTAGTKPLTRRLWSALTHLRTNPASKHAESSKSHPPPDAMDTSGGDSDSEARAARRQLKGKEKEIPALDEEAEKARIIARMNMKLQAMRHGPSKVPKEEE